MYHPEMSIVGLWLMSCFYNTLILLSRTLMREIDAISMIMMIQSKYFLLIFGYHEVILLNFLKASKSRISAEFSKIIKTKDNCAKFMLKNL